MSEPSIPQRYEISEQQISIITSVVLLIFFISFVSGYFWGIKSSKGAHVVTLHTMQSYKINGWQELEENLFEKEIARTANELDAQMLMQQLRTQNFQVSCKPLESCTQQGKKYKWYKLVLGPLSKDEMSIQSEKVDTLLMAYKKGEL